MNIKLTDKNGITLNTKDTYCTEDIGVKPKLQSKTVATNGVVQPDTGYCGLENVTVAIPRTSYSKQFTKADFIQIGMSQRYYISIKYSEHGLQNPYVDKILLDCNSDGSESTTFQTPIVASERTLSTWTIKIYVTVDLTKYTKYSGTIYLKGE